MDLGSPAGTIDDAIETRRSIRGFLPQAVDKEVALRLLELAGMAPSGSNIQPWSAHLVMGETLTRLSDDLSAAHYAGEPEAREYEYYPTTWRTPYIERRRAVGLGLYKLTGVARGDKEAEMRQRGRNYLFFGARTALVFAIDNDLEQGSWLDYGMFLQTFMLAARARGLHTCAQAAIANYPAIVRKHLGIGTDQTIVCGMALGWLDPAEPANALVPTREPVSAFTTVHGG